jgi:hypothetical protein
MLHLVANLQLFAAIWELGCSTASNASTAITDDRRVHARDDLVTFSAIQHKHGQAAYVRFGWSSVEAECHEWSALRPSRLIDRNAAVRGPENSKLCS